MEEVENTAEDFPEEEDEDVPGRVHLFSSYTNIRKNFGENHGGKTICVKI